MTTTRRLAAIRPADQVSSQQTPSFIVEMRKLAEKINLCGWPDDNPTAELYLLGKLSDCNPPIDLSL